MFASCTYLNIQTLQAPAPHHALATTAVIRRVQANVPLSIDLSLIFFGPEQLLPRQCEHPALLGGLLWCDDDFATISAIYETGHRHVPHCRRSSLPGIRPRRDRAFFDCHRAVARSCGSGPCGASSRKSRISAVIVGCSLTVGA